MHPDPYKFLVASGQVAGTEGGRSQPPHIRLWNHHTLETMTIIDHGFERQIVSLAFSRVDGGKVLYAIDDHTDHILSVWDWEKGGDDKPEKVGETKTTKETVLGMLANPIGASEVVIYGKGHVIFLTLHKEKRVTKKSGIFGSIEKPKIVTCAQFTSNGDLLTGDSNGTVIGWKHGSNHSSFCITNVHQGKLIVLLYQHNLRHHECRTRVHHSN